MFWTVLIPHLTVSAVFIGLLLRALRRYGRHIDAIIAKLDEDAAESQRLFDAARDEIRASMRAQVDAAIAEMQAKFTVQSHNFADEIPSASLFKLTQTTEIQTNGTSTHGEIHARLRWDRCPNCTDLIPSPIDGHFTNACNVRQSSQNTTGIQLRITSANPATPAEGA